MEASRKEEGGEGKREKGEREEGEEKRGREGEMTSDHCPSHHVLAKREPAINVKKRMKRKKYP